jgi:hypothetical protein
MPPTDEQIQNARLAGWDIGQPGDEGYPKEPPGGWDVHGTPQTDDIVDPIQAVQENEEHQS